jgi:hypothetical protein
MEIDKERVAHCKQQCEGEAGSCRVLAQITCDNLVIFSWLFQHNLLD